MIATVPSLLVGHPKLPAPDLASLIALAKAKPGTPSIAIGGIGSSLHLAGEQLEMMAGLDLLNVPNSVQPQPLPTCLAVRST